MAKWVNRGEGRNGPGPLKCHSAGKVLQAFDSSHLIVAMGCKGSKAKVDAPLPGTVIVGHVGV